MVIEPDLAWNNYLIEADRVLTNLKRQIGEASGAVQEAATDYLASLKVLAEYGKAINSKVAAYIKLLVRAIVLKSQLLAAQKTQARWQELEAKSESDEEKLAALMGIIKTRMDGIKRSVYIAWNNYRNAYFYLYFAEPPVSIGMDMDTARLKDSFSQVSKGVERLSGDSGAGEKIRLPQENVPITLRFGIVKLQDSDQLSGTEPAAYLNPAAGGKPAVINVSIPAKRQCSHMDRGS